MTISVRIYCGHLLGSSDNANTASILNRAEITIRYLVVSVEYAIILISFEQTFLKCYYFFCRFNKSCIRLHCSFKENDRLWGIVFIKFICSSCEVFNMDPLVKATLLRTFGFLIWVFVSAWVFVMVEDTEKDDRKEKYELLHSLYRSMALKYNMTFEEFSNFSSIAYEALSEPKPPWSFSHAFDFVLQAVTTIEDRAPCSLRK